MTLELNFRFHARKRVPAMPTLQLPSWRVNRQPINPNRFGSLYRGQTKARRLLKLIEKIIMLPFTASFHFASIQLDQKCWWNDGLMQFEQRSFCSRQLYLPWLYRKFWVLLQLKASGAGLSGISGISFFPFQQKAGPFYFISINW